MATRPPFPEHGDLVFPGVDPTEAVPNLDPPGFEDDEQEMNVAEDQATQAERQDVKYDLGSPEVAEALNHPDVEAIKEFLLQTGQIPTQPQLDDNERAAEYKRGWDAGAKATHDQDAADLNAAQDEIQRLRDLLAETQRNLARSLEALEHARAASGGISEGTTDPAGARRPAGRSEAAEGTLEAWWLARSEAELAPLMAKVAEYGGDGRAQDLIEVGRTMAAMAGRGTLTDEEATELGIFFYVVGKMGRWQTAVRDGFPVSDDTLLDIGVYVRMAQRSRDVGGWPN